VSYHPVCVSYIKQMSMQADRMGTALWRCRAGRERPVQCTDESDLSDYFTIICTLDFLLFVCNVYNYNACHDSSLIACIYQDYF